jgi:Fe-S-cluster containining protein
MVAAKPDLSKLCVNCAICCTGALFSHAKLDEADQDLLLGKGAIHNDDVFSGDRLHLPCAFLSGRTCSIYESGRPKICGQYLCTIAGKVAEGTLDIDAALQLTDKANELLQLVTAGLPAGTDITQATSLLVRGERPGSVEVHAFQRARLAYMALQTLLDRHFRSADQRLIETNRFE